MLAAKKRKKQIPRSRCSFRDEHPIGCSLDRFVEFAHPVSCFEEFAWLGAVRRADYAVFLHDVDEARGASVTDAQAALQRGSGGAAHLANDPNRVLIQGVVDWIFAGAAGFGV